MTNKQLEEAQRFVRQLCNKKQNQELGLASIIEVYKKILPFPGFLLHVKVLKEWQYNFTSGEEIPFNRQMPDHQINIARILGWKKD